MNNIDNITPYNACEYDMNVRKTIPYYELFHYETIDLLKTIKPEAKTWLDTGCGTGFTIEKAYPYFQNTYFILCDPARNMIEESKKRLKNIPKEKINIMEPISSQDLDIKITNKVDIITAIQAHHYLEKDERKKATENCYKLLNENGVYVTFENIHPIFNEGVEIGLKRWMNFQIIAGRDKHEVEEHGKRFDKNYFPITVKDHLDLLKEVGFKVYEIFWYSQMQAGFYAIK